MASDSSESTPWYRLQDLLDQDDTEGLRSETAVLGPRETARALSRLRPDAQQALVQRLSAEQVAHLFEEIPSVQAAALLEDLPPATGAPILQAMDSNDAADLLGALDAEQAEAILRDMPVEEAASARRLANYPDDVAGGLMMTEYLAYPEDWLTRQVVEDMRNRADEYAEYSVQYTYVVDPAGHLVGVLTLRDLLLTPGRVPITDIMIRTPVAVRDMMDLDGLVEFYEDNSYIALPVVDDDGRLLGVLRRSDVREALGDRANSDYLKTQGIVGGEELRSMPLLLRSRRRLSWLSANILLNFISASVIGFYTGTLEQVIALAIFIPIISDMSGCSGNQAVAVSIRELTLGLVKPFELVHVWMKECAVGIINGVVLGLLIGLVAWIAPFGLWDANAWLGLVVAVAMAINTVVAVLLGGSIPLVLKWFGADPALASGPILTTVTDMCGFMLILGLATLLLPYLTATG